MLRHDTTHSRDQVLISCLTIYPLSLRSLVVLKSMVFLLERPSACSATSPLSLERWYCQAARRISYFCFLPRSEFTAAGMFFFLRFPGGSACLVLYFAFHKRSQWEKNCEHIFFPNWRQITPTSIESRRLQSLPENRINAHTVTVGPCGPNSSLGVFPAKCFR